jgi:hypothetical protein
MAAPTGTSGLSHGAPTGTSGLSHGEAREQQAVLKKQRKKCELEEARKEKKNGTMATDALHPAASELVLLVLQNSPHKGSPIKTSLVC